MEGLADQERLHLLFLTLPAHFLLPPRFKHYGRTLVRVFLTDGTELADVVIAEGLAVPYYSGIGRQPNPFRADRAPLIPPAPVWADVYGGQDRVTPKA